jgi:hypothetical protein
VRCSAAIPVTIGTLIPEKQLWAGNPAVYVRDVTDQEMAGFVKVRHYSLLFPAFPAAALYSCSLCCTGIPAVVGTKINDIPFISCFFFL